MVLPRSAVSDAGMANWRTEIVEAPIGAEITGGGGVSSRLRMSVATVINHKGWVFEGVHNSYTVALVAVTRSSPSSPVSTPSSGRSMVSTAGTPLRWSQPTSSTAEPNLGGGFEGDPDEPYVAIYPGPASSLSHFYEVVDGKPEPIPVSEFTRWSNTAAFPQIPTRPAFRVWRKIKQQPRFDGATPPPPPPPPPPPALPTSSRRPQRHQRPASVLQRRWRFRPVAEFHATHDRKKFVNDDGASARSANLTPPTTGAGS